MFCTHCGKEINEEKIEKSKSSFEIGGIILIISFIFFRLSRKAANNFQLSTNCIEFWVFVVTLVISIVFICFGVVKVILGLTKKNKYTAVLKDIQNGTFVQ